MNASIQGLFTGLRAMLKCTHEFHQHKWTYWNDLDYDRSSRAGRYQCLRCGLKLLTLSIDDKIEALIEKERKLKHEIKH